MPSAGSPSSHRRAVTLTEILLVLCLLVIFAGIAWPALERPLAGQTLRKAADVVRAAWARARIEAMSSGQTRLFRYAIDGDRYCLESFSGPEYVPDAADGGQALGAADLTASASHALERRLPEGIVFVSGEVAEDPRAASILESQTSGDAEMARSAPILFYPDGTTSTARLVLRNEHDRCVELSLRGLTGVATVGDLYSAEGQLP